MMNMNLIYILLGAILFLVLLTMVTMFILLKDIRGLNNLLAGMNEKLEGLASRRSGSGRSRKRKE